MSKRISAEFIEDLQQRTDIIEIISKYIKLKHSGKESAGLCPFHNEKTPSFTVSKQKQLYHCFGCNASGNTITFLMQYNKLSFISSIEYLANHLGVAMPNNEDPNESIKRSQANALLSEALNFYVRNLSKSEDIQKYLETRGISDEIMQQFCLGYAPDEWGALTYKVVQRFGKDSALSSGLIIESKNGKLYDRFRNRVMFPIIDIRGNVVGFGGRNLTDEQPKYLNSPETEVFKKKNILYGLFQARQQHNLDRIIVVEGYMDVISLAQNGIHNVVASLGTALTVEQIKLLMSYTKNIILCFDGDKAGLAAANRALATILPMLNAGLEIKFMLLADKEDPDSYVIKHGKDKFNNLVEQSKGYADFLFTHAENLYNLENISGKSAYISYCINLISSTKNEIIKDLLYTELANIVNMDKSKILKHQEYKSKTQVHRNNQEPNKTPANIQLETPIDLVDLACIILVKNPEIALTVNLNNYIKKSTNYKIALFRELLMICKQTHAISTEMLIANWNDTAKHNYILHCQQYKMTIPDELMKVEMVDIIQKLTLHEIDINISNLLKINKNNSLSDEVKQQLNNLIKEKNNFKKPA